MKKATTLEATTLEVGISKATTLEEGLRVLNEEFSTSEKVRTVENILKVIEEHVYKELCLMGYLKLGAGIFDVRDPKSNKYVEKVVKTWEMTPMGKEVYEYNKNRFTYSQKDRDLIDFLAACK